MTASAKNSYGSAVWLVANGGVLVKVAELLSVDPPQLQRGTIDVTTHDGATQAMEFIGEGVYDPGEISGQVHYIAGSAGDLAMIAALGTGAEQDFKIVLKSAAGTVDLTGAAILTQYGPDGMEVNGKQTASFSLKVTGAITQAASA